MRHTSRHQQTRGETDYDGALYLVLAAMYRAQRWPCVAGQNLLLLKRLRNGENEVGR